jgi:hypothetical protein
MAQARRINSGHTQADRPSDSCIACIAHVRTELNRLCRVETLCLLGAVGVGSTRQAEYLMSIAQKMRHEKAIRLLNIHLGARTALSGDNNFTGHAVWYLAGGESPVADQIEPVVEGEVYEMLDGANDRWKHPEPIPNCYCDGIHCAGNDRRYAGILTDMWAVCRMFQHYGNIEPENEWLPEFYTTDGLEVESSLQSISKSDSCNQLHKRSQK